MLDQNDELLHKLSQIMWELYDQQQEAKIEYDINYLDKKNRSDIFTPCRMLDEEIFDELANYLIDDFINADLDLNFPAMSATDQMMVRNFLSKKCRMEMLNSVKSKFSSVNFDTLLLLSGLFEFWYTDIDFSETLAR